MLRMRMFPLRAPGDSDSEGAPLVSLAVAKNREDEFDKMDDVVKVTESFFLSSFFHLQTFALWGCLLNFALFTVAIFVTGFYESETFTERYDMRTPVTKTAMVWMPRANVSVVPRVAGAQCEVFDSRGFFGQRNYTQYVTFSYDTLPARYPLTIVLFVGFLFQTVTRFNLGLYMEPFKVGNSHITGFLERSITFPLFVLVLASKAGISDLMVLLGLVFTAWSSMLFSFFSEVLFQGDGGFLAIGPGTVKHLRTGDTVKRDGGIWVWRDGNFHYHALSLCFALANFAFVTVGLLHNFFLADACFDGHPDMPDSVRPVKVLIYCALVAYGFVLIGQVFMAYVKPKPSTIQRDRDFMIAEWKQTREYVDPELSSDPTRSAAFVDQRKKLMEGLNMRVRCAMMTEFFNGLMDIVSKARVLASFSVFGYN